MDLLIAERRKNWKKRTVEKIQECNSFVSAMYKFMDEFIYYSRDYKELRRRLRKLIWEIDKQLRNLQMSRKGEFDTEKIEQLKDKIAEIKGQL